MGKAHEPRPAKLFVGMLSQDTGLFHTCAVRLTAIYGPIDMQSDVLPWDHTDYYQHEMGTSLRRAFVFFERLIDPGDLASIKKATIRLEQELSRSDSSGTRRRINLDPGYITEAKVVLATTKDFPHRIYIGENIYAESTLHYAKNSRSFIPVDHTYPDFRSLSCRELFNRARANLRNKLHNRQN